MKQLVALATLMLAGGAASAQTPYFNDENVPGVFYVTPPAFTLNYDVTGTVTVPAEVSNFVVSGQAEVYNAPRVGYGMHLDDPQSVTMTGSDGSTINFTVSLVNDPYPFESKQYHVWTAQNVPAGNYALEVKGLDAACFRAYCVTPWQTAFYIDASN